MGDKTPAALAREHLLVDRRDIPFGACFSEECFEQLQMLGRLAEFFLFARVVVYIEE
ncbi:hypothetical protein D3C80_2144710 [compost metagenome]